MIFLFLSLYLLGSIVSGAFGMYFAATTGQKELDDAGISAIFGLCLMSWGGSASDCVLSFSP